MPIRPFLGLVALGPVDPKILQHLRTAHRQDFLPAGADAAPQTLAPPNLPRCNGINIIPPNSWNTSWLR